ncbi:hypothetical protein [Phycicoccus jejuensis]|uniref:hypothetical protein n=1 Tax=Phycicoccus jejuensis TaxID=367299 RepID=UPI00384FCE13
MNPGVDQTPAAWGDLVRAASSGYTGKRPLVSIWQGTSDTTVAPMNAGELRDQFTNVAGLSQTPTSTGTVASGVTHEDYAGRVRVTRVQGMTHGTAVDPGTGTAQCGTAGASFIDTSVCAAYQSGGYAYATGSNQNLGLYNTYYTSTLRQTSTGYWEKC